jgi:hypothetical protein
MPVRRFRSIDDMKREPRWRTAGSPDLWRAIAGVWDVGRRAAARRFPPGVYRHRSIERLDALCEQWASAHVRDLRERRTTDTT